jgi:outer membrane protein assembly factor BamB
VLHEGRVIVQCDVLGDSFLAAFDAATGEEVWRTARDDVPTWSTPTVDVRGGRSQVIVNGFEHIGGYELATGKELWRIGGGGDIPVPTPIVSEGLIFITGAHGQRAPIYAIDAMASGAIDRAAEQVEALAWSEDRRGNYLQTPLVYGEEFYACSGAGILACYDKRTGKPGYRERLGSGGSGFTASAVAADGKLYLTGEDGEVYVVAAGTTFEVLSVNDLGETCMATPAISEGVLYWRTRDHLVAIEE